jgi:hypothetical protein
MLYKNRGHFCNYCRKIIANKCPGYYHDHINPTIWYVWEHPDLQENFKTDLINLQTTETINQFNRQLKKLAKKYLKEVK